MSCIPHNIQSFVYFLFLYKNTSAYHTSYWKKKTPINSYLHASLEKFLFQINIYTSINFNTVYIFINGQKKNKQVILAMGMSKGIRLGS